MEEEAAAWIERRAALTHAQGRRQAEDWAHLRTTNPIESTFATVRLRHNKTRGNGSRAACLAMVFKLAESASRRWNRLNGYELVADVL